jgi:hypothetical protein
MESYRAARTCTIHRAIGAKRHANSKMINIGYVREQHLRTRTSRKLVPIEGVERKAACLAHTDGFALSFHSFMMRKGWFNMYANLSYYTNLLINRCLSHEINAQVNYINGGYLF